MADQMSKTTNMATNMATINMVPAEILRLIIIRAADQPRRLLLVSRVWNAVVDSAREDIIQGVGVRPAEVILLPAIWYHDLGFWQKVALADHTELHMGDSLTRLDESLLIGWPTIITYIVANPPEIYQLLSDENGRYCKLTNARVYFKHCFVKYEACRRYVLGQLSDVGRDTVLKIYGEYNQEVGRLAGNIWAYTKVYVRTCEKGVQDNIRAEFDIMQAIGAEQAKHIFMDTVSAK